MVAEVALSWVTPEVHLGWINVSDPWAMRMDLVGRDGDSLSRDKEATGSRALCETPGSVLNPDPDS